MAVSGIRRVPALITILIALRWGFAAAGAATDAEATLSVIELRQYQHFHPGKRDVLVNLFDTEFIESQEAVGMKVLGQFRDLDRPDRFVWIRGFKDMSSRAAGLSAFAARSGKRIVMSPIQRWSTATMCCCCVPRVRGPASCLTVASGPREVHMKYTEGLIVATIDYFSAPVEPAFIEFFENTVRPHLDAAGVRVLASFITETLPNNFPRLPIREADHVFVSFSRFADPDDYERSLAKLAASSGWSDVCEALRGKLSAPPEVLRLEPTPRSQLHD